MSLYKIFILIKLKIYDELTRKKRDDYMNSQDITRAIIGTTIDRGIREMAEDPKRSIRKLTDLGRRFSKSRFQTWLFSLFQELLRNNDSAYYQVLDNLLKNNRWENLKSFGLNVGYNGWTYGARIIREQAALAECQIPWVLILHYCSAPLGEMTLDQITNYIIQGKELGIHCFFLWQENSPEQSSDLLDLVEFHKDCAFLWQIPDAELNRETVSRIADCRNLMLSLPFVGEHTQKNAMSLHQVKALYTFYLFYENKGIICELPEMSSQIEDGNCSFLLLIAKDNCNQEDRSKVAKYVYNFRLEQNYPYIPMDMYGDFTTINDIISEFPCIFEVLSDGQLKTPSPASFHVGDYPSLKKLFSEAMPYLHSPKTAL